MTSGETLQLYQQQPHRRRHHKKQNPLREISLDLATEIAAAASSM